MNQDQAINSASRAVLRASIALSDLYDYLLQLTRGNGSVDLFATTRKVMDARELVHEIDAELTSSLAASRTGVEIQRR